MIRRISLGFLRIMIVLVGITFLSFALLYIAPGDPAEKYLAGVDGNSGTVSGEAIQEQRETWGLDRPFAEQYVTWLKNAVRGDLGESYATGRPVLLELTDRIGTTVSLAVLAITLSTAVAVPLGTLCACRRDGILDNVSRVISFLGISIPSFLRALLLLYVFAVGLHVISVSGENGIGGLLLPVAVLAIQSCEKLTRQVRSAVLTELNMPYVRGARARGVKPGRILFHHVLRNAWMPILTLIGIQFGTLLGGAVVVESIFNQQGLGQLAVSAVRSSDYLMLQGIVLWIALLYLIINALISLSYAALDPRVRKEVR